MATTKVRFRILPWQPRRRVGNNNGDGGTALDVAETAEHSWWLFDDDSDFLVGLAVGIIAAVLLVVGLPLLGLVLLPVELALAAAIGIPFIGLRVLHLRPWVLVVERNGETWSEEVVGLRAARARKAELTAAE